jgi:hypothetical protein
MAGEAFIPIAEAHRLPIGIGRSDREDCWERGWNVQAFTALVAGRRDDGHVLLVATSDDL